MDWVEEAAMKSRLGWFGHFQRLNDSRLPKKLFNVVDRIRGRGKQDLTLERVDWERKEACRVETI